MKLRILLATASTLAIALVIWAVADWQVENEQNAYVPRSDYQQAEGIDGTFEYYQMIKGNVYTGKIETEDVLKTRKAVDKVAQKSSAKNDDVMWGFMGPDNVGGRTRAILTYNEDANKLIAGGVSGGLFKTTDGGQNWENLSGFKDNLIVGSIARLGNGDIYAGTGHYREGLATGTEGSQFIGGGLFRSTDDGVTWSLVENYEPEPFDQEVNTEDWIWVNKLEADPANDNKLWIGSDHGLFSYTEEDSLTLALGIDVDVNSNGTIDSTDISLTSNVQDVEISADGQNIIATVGGVTVVSTDGGNLFVDVNTSNSGTFPSGGTVDLSVAPDDKDFMVASVANGSGYLRGIYATTNAGESWNAIAASSSNGTSNFSPFSTGASAQGGYDNMIIILPELEDGSREIIMGGIRMYKYVLPAGATPGIFLWEAINANFASSPGAPPSPFYVHSDIHASEMDAEGRVWVGTDGGMFRTDDRGQTWLELNKNYSTTQYYSMAFGPSGELLGGLQDNGTLLITGEGASPEQAIQFTGGDGFDSEISQRFPDFMFSTSQNAVYYRSTDGGANVSILDDLLETAPPGCSGDFYTDLALHENANNQFSEIMVDYVPTEEDPFVELFGEASDGTDSVQVTINGDTIIGIVPAGTEITVDADHSPDVLTAQVPEDLNVYSYYIRTTDEGQDLEVNNTGDTLKVQETPQYMAAASLTCGVFVSRQPLSINPLPQFFEVAGFSPGGSRPTAIEFSPDGNHLYVGYSNGSLKKISGFNEAWTSDELNRDTEGFVLTESTIYSGNGAITDVDVDYSQGQGTTGDGLASERVLISVGNYGGSGKMQLSETAASASGLGSFENIWNVDDAIEGMPCYSAVMDVNNPNVMMAGTEFGVYFTGNGGDTWTEANNGEMIRVPVFDMRQQKLPSSQALNSGVVYVGTHGRGLFRTDYLMSPVSVGEDPERVTENLSNMKVFPNPLTASGTVQFDMIDVTEVKLRVYSLDGRLLKIGNEQRIDAGVKKRIKFNTSELATGTYIIQVQAGNTSKTSKFVKTE